MYASFGEFLTENYINSAYIKIPEVEGLVPGTDNLDISQVDNHWVLITPIFVILYIEDLLEGQQRLWDATC